MTAVLHVVLFILCLVVIGLVGRHGWQRCRRDGYSSRCAGLFATTVISIGVFLLLCFTPDLFPAVAVHTLPGIIALILSLIVGLISAIALQVVDRNQPPSPSA